MGLFDFFAGAEYDPTNDRLSAPLGEEASSLALHVERCAGRYQQLRKAQHNTLPAGIVYRLHDSVQEARREVSRIHRVFDRLNRLA